MLIQRKTVGTVGAVSQLLLLSRKALFLPRNSRILIRRNVTFSHGKYESRKTSFESTRYQSTSANLGNSDKTFKKTAFTADDLFDGRLESLEEFANKTFIRLEKLESSAEAKVLELYESIQSYQASIYDFDKLSPEQNIYIRRSNDLLRKILLDPKTTFDEALLKKLFLTQPLFPTLKVIIKAYYSKGPSVFVPSTLALIPFRKLIWDAQFQDALDYVELTNGNKRYIENRKSNLKRIYAYFGGSIVGLIACIHGIVSVFFPELISAGTGGTSYGIYGIYACIVTYIVNCGFLAGLAFSSKGLENGNLMFKQSTMPHDWYLKVDQMKMCSKIVEADAEINGMDGFATRDVVSRIQQMGFEVNEPEQEVMLRQYWYSSGEGFLWVEPDIDPAEIEWWKHLEDIGVKKVWDQDLNKIEEADASEDVEDGDNGAELFISDEKK